MISAGRESTFATRFALGLLTFLATVLLGGFAASALVRYSPGFDIDENAWNPHLSAVTVAARHARLETENGLPRFYLRYLSRAARGDFGKSEAFNLPVSELLKNRVLVSASLLTGGTLGGLVLGGLLAWLAVWPRRVILEIPAAVASGLLLAVPPAVLALFFFFREWPLWLAVALALLPRVFGTARSLLGTWYASPALLAARARGLGSATLATRYVLAPAAPQLAALVGVAVVLAFGSLIPIEGLCDVPGLGQLALKGALARDLPLLSALGLIITALVAGVQWLGDLAR